MVRGKLASLCICALLATVHSSAYAQAFSVPISDKVVEFELSMPNGSQARVRAREGTMITIRDGNTHAKFSLIPALDEDTQRLSVMLLELSPKGRSGEHVDMLHFFENVGLGAPLVGPQSGVDLKRSKEEALAEDVQRVDFAVLKNLILQLQPKPLGISRGWFPNARPVDPKSALKRSAELRKIFGSGGGDCCVRCHSITICSTSVDLDCGNCDSGGGYSSY